MVTALCVLCTVSMHVPPKWHTEEAHFRGAFLFQNSLMEKWKQQMLNKQEAMQENIHTPI